MPAFAQAADQAQRLPLSAAHFASEVEVEDSHKQQAG
jgi:hypothetical protein